MSETDEITAFIAARLDEDESAAGAGARRVGMPWHAERQPGTPGGLVIDELGLVGSTGGRYAADHIARHDPARALREVVAKRALIDEIGAYEAEIDRETGCCHKAGEILAGKCHLKPGRIDGLRHLAAIWSDHPDYREGWKP